MHPMQQRVHTQRVIAARDLGLEEAPAYRQLELVVQAIARLAECRYFFAADEDVVVLSFIVGCRHLANASTEARCKQSFDDRRGVRPENDLVKIVVGVVIEHASDVLERSTVGRRRDSQLKALALVTPVRLIANGLMSLPKRAASADAVKSRI